jgi:hypothetical protein
VIAAKLRLRLEDAAAADQHAAQQEHQGATTHAGRQES